MANIASSSEPKTPSSSFIGRNFYHAYKDAEFLKTDANVVGLLARWYELRQMLSTVEPGKYYEVPDEFLPGMKIDSNIPLMIKKTAEKIPVAEFEITYNRLIGLTAAFAYENRKRFPNIQSSDAKLLGLVWDRNNSDKCKLFLSAVSGTEYFIDQFSFWPLLCGMRKYQLKKLPLKMVLKMAHIKNAEGIPMAKVLQDDPVTAIRIWSMFAGATLKDLETLVDETRELKDLVQGWV